MTRTCRDKEGIVHVANDHYRASTWCGLHRMKRVGDETRTLIAFSSGGDEVVTCMGCIAMDSR